MINSGFENPIHWCGDILNARFHFIEHARLVLHHINGTTLNICSETGL